MSADHLSVLAVCTGNQCRSPLIEFALRRRCQHLGLEWRVSSAGTAAQPGLGPHPFTSRLLADHGDDSQGWRSRRVTVDLLASVDLVLTASTSNRNEVVWLYPQAAPRTIVLLQLARYCAVTQTSLLGQDGSRSAVEAQFALARALVPRPSTKDDLIDPMGRAYRSFRRTDRRIEEAADRLLAYREPAEGLPQRGNGDSAHR